MEARKITIVTTTNSQAKKVIMSSATTLGELKADLDQHGVDYANMDFYEGVSKTEPKRDDSILPTNIPYKGTVTNELVFVLSTTNKKIRSGAATKRTVLYETIRSNHLQDAVKEEFGRNFTQVPSSDLERFIDEVGADSQSVSPQTTCEQCEEVAQEAPSNTEKALIALLDILLDNDCIEYYEKEDVLDVLNLTSVAPEKVATPIIESPYDDDELEEMLDDILN